MTLLRVARSQPGVQLPDALPSAQKLKLVVDGPVGLAKPLAEPPLPRAQLGESIRNATRLSPAATAVLLGAGGIAIFAGAGVAQAADNVPRPTEVPAPRLSPAEMSAILSGATATAPAVEAPLLTLSGSVGVRAQNSPSDVRAVQQRLKDLGFDVGVDGKLGSGTMRVIRIYESMLNGGENIAENSGRIEPGGEVAKALASKSSPSWVRIPKSGTGFVNEDYDGYSWGSSITRDVINDAGVRYQNNWLASNPSASKIGINDVSKRAGGPNRDHETHEAGLDIDVRLPRTDGTSGSRVGWRNYDRNSAEAVIRAFGEDPRVERIIIGDWTLLKRIQDSDATWKDKVVAQSDHKDHIHVDIAGANNPNRRVIVE
ncbi:MAG: penicillin-insensitive murein endopeptidase [Deltaproteobacteria bacterium]|nr:penicillin-insensitive murein endopeptidase [Deltaproteobacteria bacterium]